MAEQLFKVSGMHCASCAMLIDEELEDLAGVQEATTSYGRQELQVRFDEQQVTAERIAAIVTGLGYPATPG